MVRNTAREIAVHLSYELSFTNMTVDELLEHHLSAENFAALAPEDEVYREVPNAKQRDYICRLVRGVDQHAGELDTFIERFSKGWKFSRMPLVATAIMVSSLGSKPEGQVSSSPWKPSQIIFPPM